MGKGLGVLLLIIGALLAYFPFSPLAPEFMPDSYGLFLPIIGIFFGMAGLFMIFFSRPKLSRF